MWKISYLRHKKGFTLIELMIVVAIIIILAAVAIPNYLRMTRRAKVAAVESDMKSIGKAIEMYNNDWGTYPDVLGWDDLKKELDGNGIVNNSSSITMAGEKGGIVYISDDVLTAFENKCESGSIVYTYSEISKLNNNKMFAFKITNWFKNHVIIPIYAGMVPGGGAMPEPGSYILRAIVKGTNTGVTMQNGVIRVVDNINQGPPEPPPDPES